MTNEILNSKTIKEQPPEFTQHLFKVLVKINYWRERSLRLSEESMIDSSLLPENMAITVRDFGCSVSLKTDSGNYIQDLYIKDDAEGKHAIFSSGFESRESGITKRAATIEDLKAFNSLIPIHNTRKSNYP